MELHFHNHKILLITLIAYENIHRVERDYDYSRKRNHYKIKELRKHIK